MTFPRGVASTLCDFVCHPFKKVMVPVLLRTMCGFSGFARSDVAASILLVVPFVSVHFLSVYYFYFAVASGDVELDQKAISKRMLDQKTCRERTICQRRDTVYSSAGRLL